MKEYMKKFFEDNSIDYIEVDGHVFTASWDKTAEEVYQEWLANRNKIDNCSEPIKTNKELTEENKQIIESIDDLIGIAVDLQFQLDINNLQGEDE